MGCMHYTGRNYPTYTMYTQEIEVFWVYMAKSAWAMNKARSGLFFLYIFVCFLMFFHTQYYIITLDIVREIFHYSLMNTKLYSSSSRP